MDTSSRIAVCIKEGNDTDLRKVYPVIDDDDAEQTGMIRIVDESGEDYLHATARFIVVSVSQSEAKALLRAIQAPAATHT